MPSPPSREVVIFNAALELPASQRGAYLHEACADDPALRVRIEDLLRVHEQAGTFMETPAPEARESPGEAAAAGATISFALAPSEKPGDRIGRYKLLQQIGEGGCGVVYMAEQEEPVRRRVALKVIKLGMDTRQVIARFEAERQALALMDHPNIAKVFDAGATETGRPYFVMELIKGIPITRYCDENNLSTVTRLGLFIKVCHAIQHAHQKGIIHRDIKPSNVLVADHDGVPVPKVIDFGIAKATTGQRLTDRTLFTAFEQFMGTAAYMSPEQAKLSGLDIDTRSDIYSLGVLLYELLTGGTPFEAKRLLEAGLDEVRRIIREEEPVPPSTKLDTLSASERTTVAKHRQSDPPKLVHLLSGDLDWIVMKALEKERGRRYETVNGLAMDIQRHLDSEPVIARPPNSLYRLQKMIRRNKLVFAAVGAVALTLVAGLSFSTWAFLRERRANAGELAQRRTAEEQRLRASAAQVAFQTEQASRKRVEVALQETERARKAEEEQRKLKEMALVEAERARQAEAEARGKEAGLREIAEAALSRSEGQGYFRSITLAEREWSANNVTEAQRVLDECPQGLRNWEWHYLSDQCHAELVNVVIDPNGLQTLALAPGGDRLARIGADGFTRVRTTMTSDEQVLPTSQANPITRLALTADGRHLATGHTNGLVEMWNVPGTQATWTTNAHTSEVSALAFSLDGRLFVSASGDGTVNIREANSGKLVNDFSMPKRSIQGVALSPDNRLIAAIVAPDRTSDKRDSNGEYVGTIQIWEVATGRVGAVFTHFSSAGECVAFSPSGQHLASGHQDGTIRLWNCNSNLHEMVALRGHLGQVLALAFSPDGSRLASGGGDRTVRVWTLSTDQAPQIYRGHIDEVSGVEFTPDGSKVVSASKDGTVKVWGDASDPDVLTLPAKGMTLAFNNTGKLLATPNSLWNLETRRKESGDDSEGYLSDHGRVAFSPDGKFLATCDALIKVETGAVLWRTNHFEGHGVAFSPDGTVVSVGSQRGIVTLREAATGREIRSFTSGTNANSISYGVYDLAFSPDGGLLALAVGNWSLNGPGGAGEPGQVQLWDWKVPRLLTTFKARRFCVWSLAFSPDGKRLASAGGLYMLNGSRARAVVNPGEVQIWDIATAREVFNLKGVLNNVFGVAFSPDGKRLAAASGKFKGDRNIQNEIRIWDMESGLQTFALRGFPGTVFDVGFSPDGKRIAAIGSVLRIWSTK